MSKIPKEYVYGRDTAVKEYTHASMLVLNIAIRSYIADPADTDFQKGYLKGLEELRFGGING